jgi:short-subunit dehydrogenase
MPTDLPLAVITGSSSGIGLELAKLAANEGYSLVLAADTPFESAIRELGNVSIETLDADLSSPEGVTKLDQLIGSWTIDVLCANAGHGLGKAFLDEDFPDVRSVIETNITGTLDLLHRLGRRMRAQGSGGILITGSIAGFMPGAYQAVYNASKAFMDNFSCALRNELMASGVTVTCLMPGVTESHFWQRAGTLDTKAGAGEKDSPDKPALAGWEAMKAGKAEVSPGLKNTLEKAFVKLAPKEMTAEMNAKVMKPGSAEE